MESPNKQYESPTNSKGHALHLKALVQRFGTVVAVDGIDLYIEPGELIALLGPSGCGKTTMLRIIAGFINPTEGDVLVDGQSVLHLPPNRRGVGIVFQNYALFPHMTVMENVRYGLEAQRRPKEEIEPIVERSLSLVKMSEFADRFPRQLSGGQQQRIALARCLAVEPKILLLDEPFGALDKNLRLDMQIEIKNIQREAGITTVLVTHDQEEAMTMSDRIAVLNGGKLEQFAPPTEIYDRPATLFVNGFVGTTNLLDGRVIKCGEGDCRLELNGGAIVACNTKAPVRQGDRVQFSVRPERLIFTTVDDAESLPVTIRAIMPLGPSTVFDTVAADGSALKVVQDRTSAGDFWEVGQKVGVKLADTSACAVFPAPHP